MYDQFLSDPWFEHSSYDIVFSVLLYPQNLQGTPLLTYTFFIRTSMYFLKWEAIWNDLKPSKTTLNFPGTTWIKPGNNWHHLKPARKYPISSEISHITNFLQEFGTHMVEHSLQKKRNSANRMHLFKVFRRQTIDIIYFINVVPVTLLLVALSLSVPNPD